MKSPENGRNRDYELSLVEEAKRGSNQSLKALFEYHRGFIDFMIFRLTRANKYEINMDELRQAGQIGIWRSIGKFDPAAGCNFITYARWEIMKEIRQAIIVSRNSLKKSAGQKRLLRELKDAEVRLLSLQGIEKPTMEQLTAEFNRLAGRPMSAEEIESIMLKSSRSFLLSLSQPLHSNGQDDDSPALEETISDQDAETPETCIIKRNTSHEIQAVIESSLKSLSEKQRFVLNERFNLDHNPEGPQTLDQVAEKLGGLSRERIRQIEEKALRRIRLRITRELEQKGLLND